MADPDLAYVPERGQKRPATASERAGGAGVFPGDVEVTHGDDVPAAGPVGLGARIEVRS